MTPLHIEVGGRTWTFDGTRPVTIGRDPQSDIELPGGTVSRHHAEIRPDGTNWTLVDVGSVSGTFSNGTRVSEMRLSGQGMVRIGGAEGEALQYNVAGERPAAPEAAVLPPPGLEQTVLPGGAVPGAFVPGPALLVRTGAQSKRFVPGVTVRIGRDPANEIVVDDASVSRLHAVVESRPDGWWYVDRSTAGTFDDEGDRVASRKLTGPANLMLGHPTAGVEVEVVPIVDARQAQEAIRGKRRRRTALLVGGVVAALVLVGGGIAAAVLLTGGDDNKDGSSGPTGATGLTTAELDRAKQASVFILAADADGTPIYSGSGSIISDTGLILTNAHVGKPSAPGEGEDAEDPAILLISLTSAEDDKPVEAAYRAEPIVADGVIDLAVLQITADADGNPVTPDSLKGKLPAPIPIGDSNELRTGDEITALGFPALASLELEDQLKPALTVTRGVVSTFEGDSTLGTERAWIDSDVRIGHGNSGGASINDKGELVGINSAIITESTSQGSGATQGSSLIRPVDLASDIIDIARNGGDPSYVSPYLDAMPDPTEQTADVTVTANGWAAEGSEGTCSGTSSLDTPASLPGRSVGETVYAEFTVTGIADGTPVGVDYYTLDGNTVIDSSSASWTYGTDPVCIDLPFTIAEPIDGVNAAFTVGSDAEVLAQNPVFFQ